MAHVRGRDARAGRGLDAFFQGHHAHARHIGELGRQFRCNIALPRGLGGDTLDGRQHAVDRVGAECRVSGQRCTPAG